MMLPKPALAERLRFGRLGKNAILGTTGLSVRALIQAGYLLLLSRWLGAAGYGLFAGSVALAILAAPLANWGSALVLTRHVAHNRKRSRGMWATALIQTGVTGGLLTTVMLGVSAAFLHERVGLGSMLLLALAELMLLPAAQVATSQCFALERGGASALSICLVPAGRLLAVFVAVMAGVSGSAGHAAVAHFSGSLVGLAAAVVLIAIVDGWPAWKARLGLGEATRQGTAYALGGLAGTSYQEIDKVLILQLLGAAVVGPYTAAFRVVSVFIMPITALIGATLPRLMAQYGTGAKPRTFRAVVIAALAYGVIASVVVLFVAPFVPDLFGKGYTATARYVVMFAPWPFLFALHQCAATALTASDRQRARVFVEGMGIVLVAMLNVLFLRRYGAEASAYTLLLAEVVIASGCWIVARKR